MSKDGNDNNADNSKEKVWCNYDPMTGSVGVAIVYDTKEAALKAFLGDQYNDSEFSSGS